MKLTRDFFTAGPMDVARGLVGAYLCRVTPDGAVFRARVSELELYTQDERGCHAFNGCTARNDAMFMAGGHAYVYLCYGLHNMLNIVVGPRDYAAAVLVRSLELAGCTGPGKLTKVLGITRGDNKMDLCALNSPIWLEAGEPVKNIVCGPRIGIDYAGPDAALPWRFGIADSLYLSRPF
ncbi:MAG: DNA-3-methyladenine glycosylase [Alphaproteobacteria bacterium]|nr:DNA-3-methyladenine glycosylase [Alphaproteobacteria bacterium]